MNNLVVSKDDRIFRQTDTSFGFYVPVIDSVDMLSTQHAAFVGFKNSCYFCLAKHRFYSWGRVRGVRRGAFKKAPAPTADSNVG